MNRDNEDTEKRFVSLEFEPKKKEGTIELSRVVEPYLSESTGINASSIRHTPHGGAMEFVKVSAEKSVFFCKDCGLRFEVPGNIGTMGDIINAYPSAWIRLVG